MNYTKPEIIVLGNAFQVIQLGATKNLFPLELFVPLHLVPNPAYDPDESSI
jgi:hypothetical protein